MRGFATMLVAALAAAPAARAEPVAPVTLDVVGDTVGQAFQAVEHHADVLLRASVALAEDAPFTYRDRDGDWRQITECDYGAIDDVLEASLPTADNHLLVSVRVGEPVRHAANGVFCEYDLGAIGDGPYAVSLRGCFLAQDVSIPTARLVVLNPLPASACGLHR